jgi:hypothetical protein
MSKKVSIDVVKNSQMHKKRNTVLADTHENRWFQSEWKHKLESLSKKTRT